MGWYKDGSKYTRYTGITIEGLQGWDYHLSLKSLKKGINYPKQYLKWDCGPNSAGRALHMWEKNPIDFSDYSDFVRYCSETTGTPNSRNCRADSDVIDVLALGIKIIFELARVDGPTPSMLAGCIAKKLPEGFSAVFEGNSDWSATLEKIKSDLRDNNPVIALIAWEPDKMHYVNVVAVSAQNDIAIIDTDSALYYYSEGELRYLMDCSSYIPHKFCLSNYNLIRFLPPDPPCRI